MTEITPTSLIENWNKNLNHTSSSLFVDRLRIQDIDDSTIMFVLLALDSVCHECFDNNAGCQCWNDG